MQASASLADWRGVWRMLERSLRVLTAAAGSGGLLGRLGAAYAELTGLTGGHRDSLGWAVCGVSWHVVMAGRHWMVVQRCPTVEPCVLLLQLGLMTAVEFDCYVFFLTAVGNCMQRATPCLQIPSLLSMHCALRTIGDS
jgi:hypothetical protein